MQKKSLKIAMLTILLACLPLYVLSVEWHVANQKMIGWDAPTQLVDGSPIPEGSVLTYNVYAANNLTDPNKTNPALLTPTPQSERQFLFEAGVEGSFVIGVEAVREYEGQVLKSTICWADDEACSNAPFGIRFYVPTAPAGNLSAQ
jgi:hypothetical protein